MSKGPETREKQEKTEKRGSELKKIANFHRPSKSLTDTVITKFALKDNPRFFEPLLKSKDLKICSPVANIATFKELQEKNSKKKGSMLLHKSLTTPEKKNKDVENNPSLSRNEETAKLHIVSPVPYRQDNEFLEQENSESSQNEENQESFNENINEKQRKIQEKKDNSNRDFNKKRQTTVEKSEKMEVLPKKQQRNSEELGKSKNERKSFGNLKDELKRMEENMKIDKTPDKINKETVNSNQKSEENPKNDNNFQNPEEKKHKRASLEEKLEEKFKKLAEEKQRNLSMFVKSPDNQSKAKTIDDFLDQKFKELRQKKVIDSNKPQLINETSIKSEEFLPGAEKDFQKKTQSLENITFPKEKPLKPSKLSKNKVQDANTQQPKLIDNDNMNVEEVKKKPRKSMKAPQTNANFLTDIKKRSQSTIISSLIKNNIPNISNNNNTGFTTTTTNNNNNIEINTSNQNFNNKALFLSEDLDHRKVFEEKKLMTPTFEQSLDSQKLNNPKTIANPPSNLDNDTATNTDINENLITFSKKNTNNFNKAHEEDNQSVSALTDLSNKIIVKMAESGEYNKIEQPKKKSNLKTMSSMRSEKSRSRSVAFKVKDFAQILEFDEAENSQSLQNSNLDPEQIQRQSLSPTKEEALPYGIEPETLDETVYKSQNLSNNEDFHDQTLNLHRFPEEKLEETQENQEFFVEVIKKKPAKNRSVSVDHYSRNIEKQQKKLDEDDPGFRSSDEIYVKRSKTVKYTGFKPETPEKIIEVSNENSPISGAKSSLQPLKTKEIASFDKNNSNLLTNNAIKTAENAIKTEENSENLGKKSLNPVEIERKSRIDNKRPSSVQYIPNEDFFAQLQEKTIPAEDESSGDDRSSEESDTRKIFSECNIDNKEKKAETHSKFKKLIKNKEEILEKEPSIDGDVHRKNQENEEFSTKDERDSKVKSFFATKKELNFKKNKQQINKKPMKKMEKETELDKIERQIAEETKKIQEIKEYSRKIQENNRQQTNKNTMKNLPKPKKTLPKPYNNIEKTQISPLFDNKDRELMEEILLHEAKIQEIIDKISIKTFLVRNFNKS